ncbi:MAG TPA: site-specific DNA-methyltransferase [Acholeplasmataceae bacterium]|jgi:site-specific DNA-methyltransferase (adenine-specific)|nr:site-specific DNA-methyltransferase [Acholeplasmataceae bacterium]
MKKLERNKIDLIFADPPYFLSNDGKSIRSGKVVSVNKGDWDKKDNYENVDSFTYNWLKECHRILKYDGTIWVSGTHHNVFDIERNMKKIGFNIINIVIWHKSDPPPLIYKNKFRFSYEFIIWAKKGSKHYFNYDEMYGVNNQEMEDVWLMDAVQMSEKKHGYHPTQKPEKLLERIIKASSKEGDIVLDPFLGSGTTCYVAKRLNRKYIGIEKEEKYFNIAIKRIK